jgi:hypothetical protein
MNHGVTTKHLVQHIRHPVPREHDLLRRHLLGRGLVVGWQRRVSGE